MDLISHKDLPSASGWICAQTSGSSLDPAKDAYEEAVNLFKIKFTDDECKRVWLQDKHSMEDVQNVVTHAKKQYEQSKQSKVRTWLTNLTSRIMLYGVVLDVLAQHHPEYVALAWGAIKFVLQGVLNQEELIRSLAKALCGIADALPHVELKAILYPTDAMKSLVATLYAQIIKFVQRAINWYSEGKRKHIFTSIGRPYNLRFKDLVEDISESARKVDQLAASLNMAEQREMHIQQRSAFRHVAEMRHVIEEYHNLQYAGLLDTRKRVCEIQFSQILTFIATSSLASPELTRQFYISMRNRRRRQKGVQDDVLQRSAQLQAWGSDSHSSLVLVSGTFRTRHTARDFAADAIDLISSAKVPVVWALNSRGDEHQPYSSIDVLKQLVLQVLRQNHKLLNERSAALNAARFQSATSEEEWFNLLGSVLDGLPQVYIIVDLGVLGRRIDDQYPWPNAFARLVNELQARRINTVIKVALISYKPSQKPEIPSSFGTAIQIPREKRGKPNHASGRNVRGVGRRARPMQLFTPANTD